MAETRYYVVVRPKNDTKLCVIEAAGYTEMTRYKRMVNLNEFHSADTMQLYRATSITENDVNEMMAVLMARAGEHVDRVEISSWRYKRED
jgi:hypothetical protein